MTPHTTDTADHDDNLDARTRRICSRILDGIEETLDELAQPPAPDAATHREHMLNEARRAVQAQYAVLLCRHALCRRTKRCRSEPCMVPASAFDRERPVRQPNDIARRPHRSPVP